MDTQHNIQNKVGTHTTIPEIVESQLYCFYRLISEEMVARSRNWPFLLFASSPLKLEHATTHSFSSYTSSNGWSAIPGREVYNIPDHFKHSPTPTTFCILVCFPTFIHYIVGILASNIFSFVSLIHSYHRQTFNQILLHLNCLLEHKEMVKREALSGQTTRQYSVQGSMADHLLKWQGTICNQGWNSGGASKTPECKCKKAL